MSSTNKVPLFVLGKAANPCCFKNVKSLPMQYDSNTKAWMTGEIFTKWVIKFDKVPTSTMQSSLDHRQLPHPSKTQGRKANLPTTKHDQSHTANGPGSDQSPKASLQKTSHQEASAGHRQKRRGENQRP